VTAGEPGSGVGGSSRDRRSGVGEGSGLAVGVGRRPTHGSMICQAGSSVAGVAHAAPKTPKVNVPATARAKDFLTGIPDRRWGHHGPTRPIPNLKVMAHPGSTHENL
jgi:hypothetical protein